MKRPGAIIGLAIIVSVMAFSAVTLKNSLIAYLPFDEAKKATDTKVQVIGAPVMGTMAYDTNVHALHFTIKDEKGIQMPVIFKGPKPEDLDSAMAKATKITAQGTYDPHQGVFVAENLLVKCPSKYQGAGGGETERNYGS